MLACPRSKYLPTDEIMDDHPSSVSINPSDKFQRIPGEARCCGMNVNPKVAFYGTQNNFFHFRKHFRGLNLLSHTYISDTKFLRLTMESFDSETQLLARNKFGCSGISFCDGFIRSVIN